MCLFKSMLLLPETDNEGEVVAEAALVAVALACLLMILIGYSSYGVIFIRANAQTPMCENAPKAIYSPRPLERGRG